APRRGLPSPARCARPFRPRWRASHPGGRPPPRSESRARPPGPAPRCECRCRTRLARRSGLTRHGSAAQPPPPRGQALRMRTARCRVDPGGRRRSQARCWPGRHWTAGVAASRWLPSPARQRKAVPRRRTGTGPGRCAARPASCDEVLGLWVRADDGVGGLLGVQLEPLAYFFNDAASTEQLHDFRVVVEVGAGRVAPRVAPTSIRLAEEAGQGRAVLLGDAELLADALVPVLGSGLGHLDAETVQEQVALVFVLGEEACRLL